MDMSSKKNSASSKKVAEKELRFKFCWLKKDGVTKKQCQMLSSNPDNNKICQKANCSCVWRYCSACVEHGTISEESELGNYNECRKTSICHRHIDKGEDFVIGSEEKVIYQPTKKVEKGNRSMRINRLAIIEAVVKKKRELNGK
ncbi:MAG TPA: hypothetical protein ENI66_01215 [Candidatus Yonathbacteria bacterium]|nr:hypothetical protein [Candidatus Yonathbacteria bacterium]